jgi:excisionase family DNA binding protein
LDLTGLIRAGNLKSLHEVHEAKEIMMKTTIEVPEYIAPGDGARLLGVSIPTYYAVLSDGEIEHRVIRGRYKVTRQAVEEYLARSIRPVSSRHLNGAA